jgi:acyl-CoA synthetase (AMP-forming)/AMP-acid ligase II
VTVSIATLDEILRVHLAERPTKIAMRADERAWTYSELYEESSRVAQALLADANRVCSTRRRESVWLSGNVRL